MTIAPLAWWEIPLRLGLAIVLGILVGLNREKANKPAGVKTHLMVCLGSALIMMTSIELFQQYAGVGKNIDPGRIAAQVVTGIGFLGAGTIIHAEGGLVFGLTTAASIWTIAGIGLACGGGMYLLAICAAVLVVGSLALLNRFMPTQAKRTPRSDNKKD
ncbi:MgtC/SapB family protein [candidate division FCPU426 bacterium]|nr:MgtC/SapB family protein [candidate division FCPU426 bacterium]